MKMHPLRATFEHFDQPMSTDFRQTLRIQLLADLDEAEADAVTRQQPDNDTIDVDDIQEVTVLKKIDRPNRHQSRSQVLVAVAAVTIVAVGVAALVVNRRNADEHVATNNSSVVVPPGVVDTTPETTVAVKAPNRNPSLRGVWTTGAIPVDQITRAMLQAGATQDIVDAWILEVGSSTEYTFNLEFTGDTFRHFEATPGVRRQVDESGTFVYTSGKLDLTIVDQGHTYTFTTVLSCCDELLLRLVDGPVNGTPTDKAVLARLVALYTSATFQRNPY
ncbi:MAG: hypothetical protein ABI894_10330 [Ilumatobacteraceae bacterium]